MTTAIFTGQTTNGASGSFPSQGRYATLLAKGSWGGAIVTIEASPDGGTNWIASAVALSADGVANFMAGNGVLYRASITGSTGATNLSVWIAYET